ncbi:hypothetical protein [Steroidobacter sp.]|uniref:hypothetical protein n=1 Tax=Steroidobacter sp. TaxID=1978227 RepID=UPI001A4D9B13|nr:hypothetical protein [Steroidobacter sp.]MBL8272001.1 hypothetical protein [Steroidobacter sp.]
MKSHRLVAIALALGASLPASAADWFDRVTDRLGAIEQTSGGQIKLFIDNGGVAINVPGRGSSCSATSVLITPPAGREKDWLAMVLAAVSSGNAVAVYGNCNASTWQIESTRIFVVH